MTAIKYATADDYLRPNGQWAIATAPDAMTTIRLPFFSQTVIVMTEERKSRIVLLVPSSSNPRSSLTEMFKANRKGATHCLNSLEARYSLSSTTWHNMGIFHTVTARMAWIQRKFPENHPIWAISEKATQANLCAVWGHMVVAARKHTANNPSLLNPSLSPLRRPNKKLHCETHRDDAVPDDDGAPNPQKRPTSWKEGSYCEIYSKSQAKWFKGHIVDVGRFADGHGWVTVVYDGGKRCHQLGRLNNRLRPIRTDNRPTQVFEICGMKKEVVVPWENNERRELLVSGFVRSLERSGSRVMNRHIKELCHDFYDSGFPTFEEITACMAEIKKAMWED